MTRPTTMRAGDTGYTIIERCRGCHAPQASFHEALRLDPMPLAGQFCRSPEEARSAERYPLTWVQCGCCGLVQVLEDVDDRVLYQRYNYASSSVPGLVRHFESYAGFLEARYGAGPLHLFEIGCNDGVLLRMLPRAWRLSGCDPSDIARESSDRTYELLDAPFSESVARSLPWRGQVDVVTASNCIAHMSDIRGALAGVHELLRPGGEFLLEVHDLDATLTGQWDTIYHEHKAEWSERSLTRCLGPLGFEPLGCDRLPLHGGLLRFACRKVARGPLARPPGGPQRPDPFGTLRASYEGRRSSEVYEKIQSALARGSGVAAYGAAGRANVWLNQLPELPIRFIVDDSPQRVNKWIPVVGTPIVPAAHLYEKPVDLCVITAWNYAGEIRKRHPEFPGTWLQSFSA